jgi:hypothetical protein
MSSERMIAATSASISTLQAVDREPRVAAQATGNTSRERLDLQREAIGRPHFGQTKPAERDFYALGAWPCVASRAPVEGPPEENEMGRTFAAFVVAASLLAVASSEASAWVCFATGLGSSGRARSYDIIDAKLFALRRCERNSPVPVCALLWCRPGG